MEVTNYELERIKGIILECVGDWRVIKNRNPFSWVDDRLWMMIVKQMPYKLSGCDFTYTIHKAWVDAWNDSERQLPMGEFLEMWATMENIRNAIWDA